MSRRKTPPLPQRGRGGRGVRAGFSLLEVLAASVILGIAAAAAFAAWGISSRAPANKRVTEMGVYIATQELERLKVVKYNLLVTGSSGTDWYDKNGNWLGSLATTG